MSLTGRGYRILSILVLVLVAAGLTVAAPAGAQDGSEDTDAEPSMRIVAQDFEVDADGDVRVFLDLAGVAPGSKITADIGARVSNEADLEAMVDADPGDVRALATFEPFTLDDDAGADQATFFSLALSPEDGARREGVPSNWSYRLDEAGVYPLRIRLRGPSAGDQASLVTYIIRRAGPGEVDPEPDLDVALLVPVSATPPAGDAASERLDPTFQRKLDDFLALVDEQPDVALSYTVTADTAFRLAEDPDAVDTIAALRADLSRPDRVLTGAPYVDIDVAALEAAGLNDELIRQRDLGQRTLRNTLGLPDLRPGADIWATDRPIDTPAVAALGDLGVSHLILDPVAMDVDTPAPIGLPAPSRTPVDALVASDEQLAGAGADPVLAGYQLLARLAARASVRGTGSAVVRVDPERADAVEVRTVLAQLAEPTTMLDAVTVAEAFDTPLGAPNPVGLDPIRPAASGAYPDLVADTHRLLSAFASMVPERPDLIEQFERPLARSASPELDLATRTELVSEQRRLIESRLGTVSTPERDRVTLGARDGRFPLPITSTMGAPANVVVSLEAPDRLGIPDEDIEVTLSEGRTLVPIAVSTRATGDTPLRITVRTPEGDEILSESQYTVRSTAVSGMGLFLTVGAGAFLAIWWGRHWRRSRREHGRDPSADRAPVPDDEVFVDDVTPTAPSGSNPR